MSTFALKTRWMSTELVTDQSFALLIH